MGVFYRQMVKGEVSDAQLIEPVDPADSDADLLERKAASAVAHGWTVVRGSTTFTATKQRWESGDLCVRDFWIE